MKIRLKRNVEIADEGLVLNALTGNSLRVQPLELDIIRMLLEHTPITPIKAYILKNYDINRNNLKNDIQALLNLLEKYDFIERS